MLYPLTFQPIFKTRLWGGRNLERLYDKRLDSTEPIGESWEISDRPGDASVIANGPLAGKDLRWLMEEHRRDVLGADAAPAGAFPLLVKILDAQETLSVQVHPPAAIAPKLGGEPKTEMWYIADARPDAALYVGLKKGVTREDFERRIGEGSVEEALQRVPVKAGDVMFLPSGRLHAIGAGNVIFEIQQNSDTTYRVFDWNRVEKNGKARQLHIQESLASIDFEDFEPSLIRSIYSPNPKFAVRLLVEHPLFHVDAVRVKRGERFHLRSGVVQILGIVSGRLQVTFNEHELELKPGDFCLLPACLGRVSFQAHNAVEYLHVQAG
ncbi:MAG: mannose-6-phosphate isomerase [Verrucomicrobiota bacterium]|jgi:mannose-6-phosphate isomerase